MMYRHYFLPRFEEFDFFCFPLALGKYTRPSDQDVNRETGLRDFSLHLVVAGKGYIELDDTVHALKKGDVFLHCPQQRMRYYTSEDDRWEIYWLQFNGKGLADFLLERGFREPSIWYMNDFTMLEQSWLELLDEIERNQFSRPAKISALTYAVLIDFMCNAIPFSNKRGTQNVDRIIQLLPSMQKNAHLPYILEEWSDKVNLTPNYFCSLFKKVTRITPLAYITKCRIQNSKHKLLADPHMSIKEIAIDSGYPSVSYFNKIFMEMEGVTPGEFRKTHLK
ncbi:AraC family transcriptional regulator [Paenibacillus glycanilyticus]|uniref:AraC family transcriptional regulator n=1 Tax=Paenibacillus glycanilyticus TaxID=126569 RepID=UPI003EB7C3F2